MIQPVDHYRPVFGFAIGPWIKQFAWLPVSTLDTGMCWLQFVYSRRCQKFSHLDGGRDHWIQYLRFAPQP